jgi:hypothetical protein
MQKKEEISKDQAIIGPKESTLKFLKEYSAQFYPVKSKEVGLIQLSNN